MICCQRTAANALTPTGGKSVSRKSLSPRIFFICCQPAANVSARLSAPHLLTTADNKATKPADRPHGISAGAANLLTTRAAMVAAHKPGIRWGLRVCCHLLTTLLTTWQQLSPELRLGFADNADMSLSRRDSDSVGSSRSRASGKGGRSDG